MSHFRISVGLVIFALALAPGSHAMTIRVPGEQPTIQDGVNAASAGDTVLVGPGTYNYSSLAPTMFNGVDIVLMSETGPQTTIIRDAVYRAFAFLMGETRDFVLRGFTIELCHSYGWGAAMLIDAASPTIEDCVFQMNGVADYGGADGGAIAISEGAAPLFLHCTFLSNWAGGRGDSRGGAIIAVDSSPEFHDCLLAGNSVSTNDEYGSSAEGGAVFLHDSDATFLRCSFTGNGASGDENYFAAGGAVAFHGSGQLALVECTFHANGADHFGSGLYCGGSVVVERSILAFGSDSAAIDFSGAGGSVTLSCTDIFANEGGDWVGQIAGQLGTNGNISQDPQFCDAASGLLTLDAASPCAPENSGGCGLIGSWPVDCGTTAIPPAASPANQNRLMVRPNPVLSTAEFQFEGTLPATVDIYDSLGRLVASVRTQGVFTWEPGRAATAGVYFARVRGEDVTQSVKFVVVR